MITRNLVLNLLGQIAPLIAAVVTIPLLIHAIGVERFGVLTIAWMVIGYFSVFDLGLGRAMTRAVSERIGLKDLHAVPPLIWTALCLMFVLSLVAAAVIATTTDWLVDSVLKIPPGLAAETRAAFFWLAASVPAVILTTGLRGILEAYGRFDYTNAIRVPMGLWTFIGPLLVIPFSTRLDQIVIVLVLGRLATTLLHIPLVIRVAPEAFSKRHFDSVLARKLFAFGGWMTVSNLISPAMVYMDRFFIGAILGVGMVAYYTTPYEVVFKLNFFPEAVFGVLFPWMAARLANADRTPDYMYAMGIKMMAAFMFPMTFFLAVGAPDILRVWLGAKFAQESTPVMQILALGLCVNSFSKVAFNLLQAKGRADVTAGMHILELPIYLGVLWAMAHSYGILGAAVAWALRMLLDLALLSWAASRVAGLSVRAIGQTAGIVAAVIGLFSAGMSLDGAFARGVLFVFGVPAFLAALWVLVMDDHDRVTLLGLLRSTPIRRFLPAEIAR
jgi:O-antigen/teichoic acid export membrane protein